MMTTIELTKVLGIEEWPAAYNEVFERFCDEWATIKNEPLMDMEALYTLVDEGFIAKEGVKDMLTCLDMIKEDEALAFALQCVYYALRVYRGPHENEFYCEPAPPSLGDYRFTFPMIILTKCLIKGVADAKRRGMPQESLNEVRGAANGDPIGEKGIYGTPNMFHWRAVCSFATMYQAGAFRYEPERVPEGYRMLRRKSDGKLLMLYTAARHFDALGQFCNADEAVFSTNTASGKTDGYLIHPTGCVLNRYVELSEQDWDVAFDGGDAALSFHIPPDIPYNVQAAGESFKKAIAFFNAYFPELPVKSIQSYSWLYSPQLSGMLPETSGINRLNRELYLAPVPSGPDGFYSFVFKTDAASFDIDTVDADTSLKRGFVSFVKNGGRVHNGFMYFPADDVERFCDDAHVLYAMDVFEN